MDVISASIGTENNVEAVKNFRNRLKDTYENAKKIHLEVSSQQIAEAAEILTEPSYQIGDKVMVSSKVLTDPYSRSQASQKLKARRIGPFKISELVGKNAIRLELPAHSKAHPVINLCHTKEFVEQPSDLENSDQGTIQEIQGELGPEKYVECIIKHRKRGRGFQFMVKWKNEPFHEATWEPRRIFVDKDGAVTEQLMNYIEEQPDLSRGEVFESR